MQGIGILGWDGPADWRMAASHFVFGNWNWNWQLGYRASGGVGWSKQHGLP